MEMTNVKVTLFLYLNNLYKESWYKRPNKNQHKRKI